MKTGLTILGIIGAGLIGIRGCNMAWNNRTLDKPAYTTHSYATGLYGHVEYTRYFDNSREVKIYPGFAHRMFDSELYQDLDGDGKVDRIRRNGAEWKMNRLSGILVRVKDYESNESNKKRFDKADAQLRDLMNKYDKK